METKERLKLHRVLKIIGVVSLVMVGIAFYLGITSSRHMKGVIRGQFNDQQLVLARTTAERIERNIQNAIADLTLLNSLPAVQYNDPNSYDQLLMSTMPVLYRDNIIEIRRVDRDGNTMFIANDQGIATGYYGVVPQEAGAYMSWASELSNRGNVMGTGARPRDPSKDKKSIVLDLITPTREEAVDALHPRPSRGFAGYLKVTLDVSKLLREIIPPIRSGKTGYAWVIDSSGNFLHHPEASFIGENAFEVRSSRNPAISFNDINQIQREEMLRGKEGRGTYTSGWHRDVAAPMEKLIAYSPVRIQGPYLTYNWSVAVVAPADEVEAEVSQIYGKQILLQGFVIFIIVLGSASVVLHELRWSTILEQEVALKTDDIRRYTGELERSEAKYRSLIESAEDMIFTLDSAGVIKTANQHMARVFGVSGEELAGQSLFRFLPREQATEQLDIVRKALSSDKAQRAESGFNLHDRELWFNIQYIPVREAGREHEHVLGIARDITDRKNLERQLINSEKLASLGTLAAGVAHEINNPIGIMLGFCDLMLERMDPGTMEYNDLKTIERHGLHCKSIVERLLSFARMSEEAEDRCDLNENIQEVVSVVKHTLDINRIRLETALASDLPPVNIDSRGLQQVLLNLVGNAIHAMDGDGVLRIISRTGRREEDVELIVADTGCGIRKELIAKIFDPFFTTKKVGEGTGLGLSVSYGIVSKYGGTVECASHAEEDGPGETGTVFTVTLKTKKDAFDETTDPSVPPLG
ncbi:sensor histidine kinase [Syntrophobacter fumaroxidans]|uniref:histidine kinase n=1 Tax=Syntrophobacter fumaroxidans (strain DSM 10017 / MPOB) TaxID=335543 RepID=A0LFW9_SYNFM|nr:sensor histidine kinase [Syntrophobacter fumaroxidans]ABK16321.1 PAS/PAC sensor signal transduction histidine kinase [Syntrophobacter fumaroxidans MPOB]